MTAELIGLLGMLGILVGICIYALWITFRAGGYEGRIDEAERRGDDDRETAERLAGPTPGPLARARAALRELRRRGVR